MKYYPIGIPTLCRYDHLKRCVDSLRKNTHANKTELIISLDYPPCPKYQEGYDKISKYVDNITGFDKVTIIRQKDNLGAVGNWLFVMDYIFSKNDAAIMTEDDNEFSPCFLDYMNKALDKYKNEDKIYWITGHSQPYMKDMTSDNVIFKHGVCAFGMGLWRDKEEKYRLKNYSYFEEEITNPKRLLNVLKRYPLGIPGEISMLYKGLDYSDIRKGIFCRTENVYQVWPRENLVRNWGYDGSGEHCGADPAFSKQAISGDDLFELPDYPIKENLKELQYDRWTKFLSDKKRLIRILVKLPLYIVGFNIYKLFKKWKNLYV